MTRGGRPQEEHVAKPMTREQKDRRNERERSLRAAQRSRDELEQAEMDDARRYPEKRRRPGKD
jgi:hypothetical protein